MSVVASRLTVLRSAGRALTKRWRADGTIEQSDSALWVRPESHDVAGVEGLHRLLAVLQDDPTAAVIRGEFVGEDAAGARMPALIEQRNALRQRDGKGPIKPRAGHVFRVGELFPDVPRSWLMLDVDGFVSLLWDAQQDPERACIEFIDTLPHAFHGRSFVWQLSASAGHATAGAKLKAHLWFHLAAPLDSAQLRAWADTVPGIDPAVFSPVQLHYTAAPGLDDGQRDPMAGRRLGLHRGATGDVVPLVLPADVLARARTASSTTRRDMADPRDKPWPVGPFCTAVPCDTLAEVLPDLFTPGRDARHFTWAGGSGAADGVFITDDGQHLVSTHATAPTGTGRATNAFDFLRLHAYGHLDAEAPEGTALRDLPSTQAMNDRIRDEWPDVWAARVQRASADDDFAGLDDDDSPEDDAKMREGVRPKSASSSASSGVVNLTRAADIEPEPIAWLWNGWLAQGKLHILAGAPGHGKTTLAMALASTVSCGGCWPDGTTCAPGNVLIWSGEDDPSDTLVPRLAASGADMGRVFFITSTSRGGKVQPFDPATDMAGLKQAAEALGGVSLLVVDPVVSAVGSGTDSHKNTEVRRALQPLVDLGAALRAAVLGISHFTKGTAGRDPVERVSGSLAFGALARVVMGAAKLSDKPGRVLVRAKSNIGPDGGGFEYLLEQTDVKPGISASRVLWGAALAGRAQDLLAEAEAAGPGDSEARDVADFLRERLADGAVPSKTIEADVAGAGFSLPAARAAFRRLGGKSRKVGRPGDKQLWMWELPPPLCAAEPGDDPLLH